MIRPPSRSAIVSIARCSVPWSGEHDRFEPSGILADVATVPAGVPKSGSVLR